MFIGTCNLDINDKMFIDHPFEYIHIMNMGQTTMPF